MNDSIMLDKKKPTIQNFILALIIGLAIGWFTSALVARTETKTTKTILVPSKGYATPYEVCREGFPFIVMKVMEQGKTDSDRITWVAGHPLNQKQVIVCSKMGAYSDIWKPGMMIALDSATPT